MHKDKRYKNSQTQYKLFYKGGPNFSPVPSVSYPLHNNHSMLTLNYHTIAMNFIICQETLLKLSKQHTQTPHPKKLNLKSNLSL